MIRMSLRTLGSSMHVLYETDHLRSGSTYRMRKSTLSINLSKQHDLSSMKSVEKCK